MATHDYVIANASGAAVRADLNNALAAIVSNNSGSSEPGTTYAFQWWADTNASQLKLRNAANDDWVVIQELDGTLLMENGTVGSPGLAFASDTDTGLFRPAANQLAIATNGVERVEFGTSEVVFNDGGADIDFRVEGDTNANLFLVDAGNDRVNIGGTIQVAGSRGGSLQPSDNDSLELFTSATSGDANTGCGLTFFNHDGSGSEMGGTIQVAKENGTDDNTASYMRFATRTNGSDAAERVRIDSSGRLLVGTTTSGTTAADDLTVSTSADTGITIRSGTSNAGSLIFADGTSGSASFRAGIEYYHSSDHMAFTTNGGNERVRIDSSGRVGIDNNLSNTYDSTYNHFCIGNGTGNYGMLIHSGSDGGGYIGFKDTADGSVNGLFNYIHGTGFQVRTEGTERMRIDGNGLVSTIASGNSTNYKIRNTAASGNSVFFIECLTGASSVTSGGSHAFIVKTDGGISNVQSNNSNLCDEREKKNIVSLESKWDKVKNWELKKFHYNDDADTNDLRYGVIAQQVETVCPEVISDWKKQDAEEAVLDDDGNVVTPAQEEVIRKGVKEQQMMWMAIKALQEAITKIETLETKVAALEAG